MGAVKLTKTFIDGLQPDAARRRVVYDSEVPGLHVVVSPRGTKTLALLYRTRTRRKATVTIGRYPTITLAHARDISKRLLLDVAQGGDPARELALAKRAPTISELCDRFLAEHVTAHNKPTTEKEYRRLIETKILPAFASTRIGELTRAEVKKWHYRLQETPRQANHALAVLSKIISLAASDWELRPDNPCRGVKRYPENRRERFLSADEFKHLGGTLAKAEIEGTETEATIAAIRLLVLTGCRLSEILTLRWDHIDFDHGCLRLPDSKTGAKIVHLAAPALAVLAGIKRRPDDSWVILGLQPGTHLVNLHTPWDRIRKDAGIPDVRLHDLRHSFASVGAAAGMSLTTIGKMLGHAQAATTARYAHLAADSVKQAVEAVASRISGAMAGKAAEIVPIKIAS